MSNYEVINGIRSLPRDNPLSTLTSMAGALGTVFYVDGTSGLDTNTGLTKEDPVLTVTAALGKCTNSKGDVIQIIRNSPTSPPVSETFPIAINKSNVTIRGVLSPRGAILSDSGIGSDAQNEACFEIGAHYVTIEDLYLGIANEGSSGGVIEFNGTNNYFGCNIRRCTIETQYAATYGVYVPYDQPYLLIEDCIFGRGDGGVTDNFTDPIKVGNCTGGMFRRNVFNGYTGIGINCGAQVNNLVILDNRFRVPTGANGEAITFAAGSANNYIDGNHAAFGKSDPTTPFRDLNNDDSNAWGLNYTGVTATLPSTS